MTNEELIELFRKAKEYYGEDLPDPEVHPKIFVHMLKMYRYYNENDNSGK